MESNRSIDGVTERIVVTSEQRDASRAIARLWLVHFKQAYVQYVFLDRVMKLQLNEV